MSGVPSYPGFSQGMKFKLRTSSRLVGSLFVEWLTSTVGAGNGPYSVSVAGGEPVFRHEQCCQQSAPERLQPRLGSQECRPAREEMASRPACGVPNSTSC